MHRSRANVASFHFASATQTRTASALQKLGMPFVRQTQLFTVSRCGLTDILVTPALGAAWCHPGRPYPLHFQAKDKTNNDTDSEPQEIAVVKSSSTSSWRGLRQFFRRQFCANQSWRIQQCLNSDISPAAGVSLHQSRNGCQADRFQKKI
jgi:hypothetical protein